MNPKTYTVKWNKSDESCPRCIIPKEPFYHMLAVDLPLLSMDMDIIYDIQIIPRTYGECFLEIKGEYTEVELNPKLITCDFHLYVNRIYNNDVRLIFEDYDSKDGDITITITGESIEDKHTSNEELKVSYNDNMYVVYKNGGLKSFMITKRSDNNKKYYQTDVTGIVPNQSTNRIGPNLGEN